MLWLGRMHALRYRRGCGFPGCDWMTVDHAAGAEDFHALIVAVDRLAAVIDCGEHAVLQAAG